MSSILPNGNCVEVVVTSDNSAILASCNTTITGGGGGISDGDKGDITVSGSGATWTVDNDAVTFAKMQNVEEACLLGRESGVGTGDPKVVKLDTQFVWTTIGGKPALSVSVPSDASKVSTATQVISGTGLTGGGALSGNVTVSANFGTSSGTVCQGNDSRLTDARTPTTHKTSHETGGTDAIAPADIGAAAATHTHGVGDLTAGSASSGQVLTYNGTAWAPATPAEGSTFDPATKAETWSDFLGGNANPWGTSTNGTGAQVQLTLNGNADHPGVANLTTGTTSTGRAAVGSNQQNALVFGTRSQTFSSAVLIDTNLSSATQRYDFEVGFLDNLAGSVTAGVYFDYSDNVNSGKWLCVCTDSGGTTTADSGITVAASTYYRLDIEVNAAASSAVFKIDGTTVATITANIPSGTGNRLGVAVNMRKSVGTTARENRVDYLYYTSAVVR